MDHISATDNHLASHPCRDLVSLPKVGHRLDRLTTLSRHIVEEQSAVVFFATREETIVPKSLARLQMSSPAHHCARGTVEDEVKDLD